jgi:methionyl-tRNA formyltransferase
MHKGAALVLKTVKAVEANDFTLSMQKDLPDLKSAPKIYKDDCRIEWAQPSQQVVNFIRGLSPYPAAWTEWSGRLVKIFDVQSTERTVAGEPGTLHTDQESYAAVKTGDGTVEVLSLQVQGKKRMTIAQFLNGNKL